ncbi:MAG TPA: hypothetical protein VE871_07960 [Longimicrobium sp.]|nr:hypothetical protein [Longimicrobium sp.]
MRSHTILLILILCMLAVGREWGISKRTAVLAAVTVMLAGLGVVWALRLRRRRPADGGFRYVYVEANGAARELSADEQAYLQTEFPPTDGGRPYIKTWYGSRTPGQGIAGYLRRDRLPPDIRIRPAPPEPVHPGASIR